MLSVAIDRDQNFVIVLDGVVEGGHQCSAVAFVLFMLEQDDVVARFELFRRAVVGAVVNDQNVLAEACDFIEDRVYRINFVEYWECRQEFGGHYWQSSNEFAEKLKDYCR